MNKILIVDDIESNIKALKFLLEDKYQIFSATTGKEAIEIARNNKIDLILLDIILPDLDGYEVCKILKNDDVTKDIPVIFITAKLDEDSISKAYEVGGIDYITKPLKPVEILCRIKTQLKLQELIKRLQNTKIELEQLASKDFLTGIYNRRSFEAFANALINSHKEIALILIDIDHFKYINDTYGHLIGDEVIKYIVDRIRTLIRNDDLFARIGGEEFVILLPDTSLKEAKKIAEKLRDSIYKDNIVLNKLDINITISLGVASLTKDETLKDLLQKVDIALYKAKKNGRNRVELFD